MTLKCLGVTVSRTFSKLHTLTSKHVATTPGPARRPSQVSQREVPKFKRNRSLAVSWASSRASAMRRRAS